MTALDKYRALINPYIPSKFAAPSRNISDKFEVYFRLPLEWLKDIPWSRARDPLTDTKPLSELFAPDIFADATYGAVVIACNELFCIYPIFVEVEVPLVLCMTGDFENPLKRRPWKEIASLNYTAQELEIVSIGFVRIMQELVVYMYSSSRW